MGRWERNSRLYQLLMKFIEVCDLRYVDEFAVSLNVWFLFTLNLAHLNPVHLLLHRSTSPCCSFKHSVVLLAKQFHHVSSLQSFRYGCGLPSDMAVHITIPCWTSHLGMFTPALVGHPKCYLCYPQSLATRLQQQPMNQPVALQASPAERHLFKVVVSLHVLKAPRCSEKLNHSWAPPSRTCWLFEPVQ